MCGKRTETLYNCLVESRDHRYAARIPKHRVVHLVHHVADCNPPADVHDAERASPASPEAELAIGQPARKRVLPGRRCTTAPRRYARWWLARVTSPHRPRRRAQSPTTYAQHRARSRGRSRRPCPRGATSRCSRPPRSAAGARGCASSWPVCRSGPRTTPPGRHWR